jgi:hypothetical protein
VIQNRRNDIFFNPRIGSFNVKTFLSFIQADGYEPFIVDAVLLKIDDMAACEDIAMQAVGEADGHRAQRIVLTLLLHAGFFRPGQLFRDLLQHNIDLVISRQEFMDIVAAAAETFPAANFVSGYWADHWTYYLDMIETYLSIYPDWEKRILFDEQLPYFSSPVRVPPRSQKYVVYDEAYVKNGYPFYATTTRDSEVRSQYHHGFNKHVDWDTYEATWMHDENGIIFSSTPMEKLFLLVTLKFASRDPYGVGILYEGGGGGGGQPGWKDAANNSSGLVGMMIGSGTPELYELCVLMKFVKTTIKKYQVDIAIPIELYHLVSVINVALDKLQRDYVDSTTTVPYPKVPPELLLYWDTVATAQEEYRWKTNQTFLGHTHVVQCGDLDKMLQRWLGEIDRGIQRGHQLGTSTHHDHSDDDDDDVGSTGGVPPTYFDYQIIDWEPTGQYSTDGHAHVRAIAMEIRCRPMFLEGPTRRMKTIHSTNEARVLYDQIRASPLRDVDLRMYTISAQSSTIGPSMVSGQQNHHHHHHHYQVGLPTGWLEHQSVWLHMSYKFYLELLRHELYDEFWEEMESGGMLPFVDPSKYGRSVIECSSFIASSVLEDPSVRGRGFLPRWSGATSEFLSMWIRMMIGPRPFFLNTQTGQLQMQLIPTLPLSFFLVGVGGTLTVTFKLFSAIDVSYYNVRGTNLYQVRPSRYVITLRDGTVQQVEGAVIDSDLADKIRRIAFIATLEVYFE